MVDMSASSSRNRGIVDDNRADLQQSRIAYVADVETEERLPLGAERASGRTIKWGQMDSRVLTRLRSVVLPLAVPLPASVLLRFVKPPTLLPMLLLKTPLLPELDMIALDVYCE